MKNIYRLIWLNRFISSYRIKFAGVLLLDLLGLRHLFLRFDPVNACNLQCSMCYYSDKSYKKKIRGYFTEDDIERIAELFFQKTLQLVIGCASEPTLYKNYPDIVRLAKMYKIPYVGLTTNAQLIQKDHIESLVKNQLDEITISMHGVSRESYEKFMVSAEYGKLKEVLMTLDQIKKSSASEKPHLRINYTVNTENLEELLLFFDEFGEYGIDTLQIRPMADVGKTSYQYQKMTQSQLDRYREVTASVRDKCRFYGITCLVTGIDPNFQVNEKGVTYPLAGVLRTIHPNKVWQVGFKWREQSYRNYCQEIGWRKMMLGTIFGKKEYFKQSKYYLKYDVDL